MTVSITACSSYESQEVRTALTALLEPLGGLNWVQPGMKIAIKANLVTFMKPEAAATTHPALLCALIEMLTEKGASVTLGDSPGGLYNGIFLNRVYAATGMKAAEQAGATLNHNFSVKEASFPEGKAAKTFSYTGWLDEADAIINFCKLKTHGMMAMSGAAKNMFGAVPGTVKPEYHYRFPNPADFADMIVDLNEYFKPRLAIIDGVVGMEGNGPTAGTPRPIGILIASENPHAADLLGSAIIGLNPGEVPTLTAAMKRNLIPERPEELELCGINWKERIIPDYQLVETTHSLRFSKDSEKFFGKVFSKIADRALASRPKLKKSECVGCRECEKICPADAITMKNKKPQIDRKQCIRCFCCQEFCPKGALKVHRPALAKMLSK
ncbi:MAG: DUF362 domain-containing protein [Clostridia bacterium]|nr:DUF362 domain-containing protein [Clostridia bacterium]